ncbi:cytochrome P450 [Mycena belliarum]|uniref:Cytochrome P450 n=1 Tax=Mycena belliarum TaxID=1033014 RepID=A0AAD6U1P4_9AGAR|nr:cytochrome P450 [Mycena belliae]
MYTRLAAPTMTPTNPSLLVLLAAVVSHLLFKRHEPTTLKSLAVPLVVLPAVLSFLPREKPSTMLISLFFSYSIFYAGLLLSITAYRISPAHSLAKYPGPLACKISKLWLLRVASQGKLHLYVKSLHDKYGPIVRVGPNELSIADISFLPSVLGANGMPKGPLWDGRTIGASSNNFKPAEGVLINARDLKRHAAARKAWNTAFVPAAIKGYEALLVGRVAQLIDVLKEQKGRTIDVSRWFSFFSFDFMGDLAFGGGFELMREGDKDRLWITLERGLAFPSLVQHIPWCTMFLRHTPMVGRDMRALAKFAAEQAQRRLQEGSVHNDLFYFLTEHKRAKGELYPFPLAVANSVVAIIAGADTTATVLSNAFFNLLSHPQSYKLLQAEVDEFFPRGPGTKEPTDASLLSNMPYLNAVIKETLRLQPPVPTSLQRAPTVGGGSKVLGDGFVISEGTAVLFPPYTIQRDPRYFSPDPDSFIPERWLAAEDDPLSTLNQDAFIPFSAGPANCIGRNLAMIEMRMVIAHVMRAFDLSFEDGYDRRRWESDLRDYFVLHKGRLPVVLHDRIGQGVSA